MLRKKIGLYIWLFSINLFISAFTFGGGYVVVPMIKQYFVTRKKLFTEDELMDMAAVAQSTPGAIAINLSALAGYKTAGIPGILISSSAAVLPPLIILGIISQWYTVFAANTVVNGILKGMQAGVSALIVDLIADMTKVVLREKSLLLTAMIPAAFLGSFFLHINVAVILIVCCFLCLGKVYFEKRRDL